MEKIIFLDVDGVLNNFVDSWSNQFGNDPDKVMSTYVVDPRNVLVLYELLAEVPDAKVVMSSTWAVHPRQMVYLHLVIPGLKERLHADWRTPRKLSSTRGQEIGLWLHAHPEVTHWVVLEDSHDAWLESNAGNVIQTNTVTGLTYKDVRRAVEILDATPVADLWGIWSNTDETS